jgi:flagellar biogenesis protein FliO
MSAANRVPWRRYVSAFFFALAIVLLLMFLLSPVHAQSVTTEPESEAVYIRDPCSYLEPGSFGWYLQLCLF